MTIISSLTFVTTLHQYGPYGQEEGTQFFVPKGTGWINGFQGRSGRYLDAIGVCMKTSLEVKKIFHHIFLMIAHMMHNNLNLQKCFLA